jgi:HEAT repeat protein
VRQKIVQALETLEALEAVDTISADDKVALVVIREVISDPTQSVSSLSLSRINDIDPKTLIPLLSQLVDSQSLKTRRSAVHLLGKLGPKADSAVPFLGKTLQKERDASLRIDMLNAIIAIDPEAKTSKQSLTEALENTDAQVRKAAANQLVKVYYQPSIQDLCKALEHSSLEMRMGAAQALGEMGSTAKEAIPSLKKALKTSKGRERFIILDSLYLIDPDSFPMPSAARQLIDVASDDTDLIVSLRVPTLLDSILFNKHFFKEVKKRLNEDCPILARFQFDPVKDVSVITAASGSIDPLNFGNSKFYFLLTGRFGKEKAFDIVNGDLFGRKAFAACISEESLIACDERDRLEEAITRKKDKHHPKRNMQLVKILGRVDSSQTFWLAKAFSEQDRAAMRSTANEEIANNSLGLTFHIDFKQNATLVLQVFTSDTKTADYWKEEAEKAKEQAIGLVPFFVNDDSKLAESVVEVIKSTKIEVKGSDLVVELTIKAEVLEQLAKRFWREK